MKRMKKLLALLLVVALAVPTFTGCGDSDAPVTLTVYTQLANYSGEQVGWSAKVLLEKFNVILNIVPDADGVYETRMESGNLGDIVVWGADGTQYQQAVSAGMLYDWEEDNLVQEYGTYIWENMQLALKKNKDGNSDGKIHGFGHNVAADATTHDYFFYTWDIRYDLYKELGCPEVKDLDAFIELMKDMKEICPTDANGNPTYAVNVWPDWDGNMVMYVKAFAQAYYGYDEQGIGLYDSETGEYHDALEENGPYLEMLKFFNTLWQEGLMDPNSGTNTYDEMADKVRAGGVFFSIFNYSGSAAYNTAAHQAEESLMLPMVMTEATPPVYALNPMGGNRIWSIGSATEYPELCMEIINWLCTPDGYMTYNYGPQDLCWYYAENEDGETKAYLTELGESCKADRKGTTMPEEYGGGSYNDGCLQINNTTWSTRAINPTTGEPYNADDWSTRAAEATCDLEQFWRDTTGALSTEEYMESMNYKVILASDYAESSKSEEFQVVYSAVTDALVTYSWKAIKASSDEEFDQIVDEMIKQCYAYGYEQTLAFDQAEAEARRARELYCNSVE